MNELNYTIGTFTFAIVLFAVLINEIKRDYERGGRNKSFIALVGWVCFFCVVDGLWGIFESTLNRSRELLFIISTIFHASTVLTTLFWMFFVLDYLGEKVRHRKVYLYLEELIVIFQLGLLLINIFTPTIFSVNDKIEYVPERFRPVAFANQYITYLLTAMCAVVCIIKEKGETRKRFISALCFAMGPALTGILQFMFFEGPFYSVGYFISVCVIYIFIVSKEREENERLTYKENMENIAKEAKRQHDLSHIDGLTGVNNRLDFEEDVNSNSEFINSPYLVYITADVNGLKETNDNLGHLAGDELIDAAATLLDKAFFRYGKIYRIGGDEFAAILNVEKNKFLSAMETFEQDVDNWKGELVEKLSVSLGFALREGKDTPLHDMIKMADEGMYEKKRRYYLKKGIDRRGQYSAYNAVCSMYRSIIKVNMTTGDYLVIKSSPEESKIIEGMASKVSDWIASSDYVRRIHPEDISGYKEYLNPENVKAHFARTDEARSVTYRIFRDGEYKNISMDTTKAEDYSPTNETVYIFTKYSDG